MSRQPTSVELAAARVAAVHDGKPDRVIGSLSQRVPHSVRKAGQHADLSEIGTYGLRQYGGFVAEEWLRQLQGSRRAWVYREMIDNDPVIGAILYAIEMLARGVPFTVNPREKDNGDADFVTECMDDMSHTWDDFISEALSMLGYGWSFHEIVYKRRQGPQAPTATGDGLASSKYTDGRIGWRKLPVRAQETLQRWEFAEEDDGLRAMEQIDYHGRHNTVPIEKALLFRTSTRRGNPEGRALALDTPIPTPDGWRTMADLVPGSRVFDESGRISYVTAVADWNDRPCYRLTFADETSIVADENHQWSTRTTRHPKQGISTTAQIAEQTGESVAGHSIKRSAPLDYVAQHLTVAPYLLGLWLGDGAKRQAVITCHEDDVAEQTRIIEGEGYAVTVRPNGRVQSKGRVLHIKGAQAWIDSPQGALRALGVLENKHVPPHYLRGSVPQRLALLQGLMDSDGCVDALGRCEFVNTNRRLVDAATELVRSLGCGCHVSLKRVAGTKGGMGITSAQDAYSVKFTPSSFVPFRLSRKAARCSGERRARRDHYIVKAERIENQRTRCIEVDSSSHLFLAGESMVPTHNSILRNSFIPWWRKKNIEEIEAIGIERDLAGLPVMKAPENFDIFAKANQEILAAVQHLVTSIRRDESEGVVLPTGWELELLSSGGSRQISPDVAIRRYEQRIAASVLADFILIGQDSVGSFAMVDVKADLFGVSVDTVLDMICEVINRYAIPRLLALNGMDVTDPPQVTHGSVGRINLERVGTFLNQITLAGAPIPWSKELLEALFAEAGLPANFDAMQEATPGELVEKPGTAQPVSCPSCDAVMSAQQAQSGTCPTCGQPVQPPQPPDREPPPEPLSKAEVSHGAMVALYPPAATAERLSQDGGESADELHLTLAFLGPAGAITNPDELRQAVALWAARTPPLEGQVSGTGKFTAGPVPVSYASADVPGLPEARQRLVENLQRAGTPPSSAHGFTPHITLAYDRRDPQIENHPLSFDRATLKVGDERHDFPLAGIRKADAHRKPTADGQHVINVAPVLQQRARLLEHSYAHDVKRALGQLGETAQRAYLTVVQKADSADVAGASMAQRVIDRLGLGEWFQKVLQPVLKSHTQRVMQDTLNTLKTQIGLSVNIPDFEARQILANGGTKLGLVDVEQQVRDAIMQAITEGRSQGLGPEAIARRIREYVPAGRFTNAGSAYRSKLIARTETLSAQRLSTLAAYRAAPNVTAVELRDGLLASSDATCEARDGDIVSFDAAASLAADEHPAGTLSLNPVIVSAMDVLPE